jgi:hypothetical protein
MEQIIEYVAEELLKLQINYADIHQYDEFNTIRITKESVHYHNSRIMELSNILIENKNDNTRKSN